MSKLSLYIGSDSMKSRLFDFEVALKLMNLAKYHWETVHPSFDFVCNEGFILRNASASAVGNKIYHFGGLKSGQRTNDMYMLKFPGRKWFKIEHLNSNDVPKVFCHTSSLVDDTLVIIGTPDNFQNQLVYFYDLILNTWERIPHRGSRPVCFGGHSANYYMARGILLHYGGNQGQTVMSKLSILELAMQKWIRLSTKGKNPGPRTLHCSSIVNDKLFIYGGWRIQAVNDLHVLELNGNNLKWNKLLSQGPTPPRVCQATMIALGGTLLIFGGYIGTGGYGQLLAYDILKNEFVETSSPFQTAEHSAVSRKNKMIIIGGAEKYSESSIDYMELTII